MEIDFLGLNSKQSGAFEEERRKKTFSYSAIQGADISLSLSTTSSSVNFEGDPLDFGESNNTWAASLNNMIPTCSNSLEKAPVREASSLAFVQTPVLKKLPPNTGFLYDLNEKPADLRDMTEPTAEPALLTILYSGSAHVYHDIISEKANRVIQVAGQSSSASSSVEYGTKGYRYTPTVAMARRATLARFLEKRMHRLTSTKTSNLVAKSPDSQTWNINVRCSKKKNSTIRKPSDGK